MLSHLSRSSVAFFLLNSVSYAAVTSRAPATCNGFAELCNRSYGNITIPGTHDAYAIGPDVGANQDQSITTQLNDGIRMIQLQALQQSNGIELCHTNCVIHDGGPAANTLTEIKTWLQNNQNNVVTVLIANVDNIPAVSWETLYKNVGLDTMSYSPPTASLTRDQWPNLGDMISAGTQLVTFLDNQADFTQVPYIIDEFSNVWETPFDVTSPDSFQCVVNRTHGNPATQLFLINHFLDSETNIAGLNIAIPDKGALLTTNGVSGPGSLGAEVQTCIATHTFPPNFMLVDFYEFGGGSVFEVAASANGLQYTPTSIAQPVPTNGSTNGNGNSNNGGVTSTPLNGASGLLVSASRQATKATIICSVLFGVLTAL